MEFPPSAETPAEPHLFAKEHRIAFLVPLEKILLHLSPFERLSLYIATVLLAISTFVMVAMINNASMVQVPSFGGSLTEGIVGTPRFVNPLLATTDTDRDITMLVYSGLMRANTDGTLIPDLAESYEIDETGTSYTFHLRPDATFHDNSAVTAQDVYFTVTTAQNPLYKSVKRPEWDGVTVEVLDDQTVHFRLPKPYAPFLEATTLGILPQHLWQNIDPGDFAFHQLNTRPIGSGPYKLANTTTDDSGAVTRYTLRAFPNFVLGRPLITTFYMRFFGTIDDAIGALDKGTIQTLGGISYQDMASLRIKPHALTESLPRIFAIFFNQGKNDILTDANVRRALSAAVDRQTLIDQVLGGLGYPITGPLPPNIIDTAYDDTHVDDAALILDEAGWILNEATGIREKKERPLTLSIATADTPELVATAEFVANAWRNIGAQVTVKVFSGGDLHNTVIRPRDYDALLFGEVVGRAADVYAFWHSSQRNDPGLNLALYTNTEADTLLNEARRETDSKARSDILEQFSLIVEKDTPAVFLFAPEYVYVVPQNVLGVTLGTLTNASERFSNIYRWHRETEYVWSILESYTHY